MDVTYKQLIEFHRARIEAGCVAEAGTSQVFRNQMSTLHGYLACYRKTTDGNVGRELRGSIEEKIADYLAALGQQPKTLSDKRSHLRAWKSSFELLEQRLTSHTPTPTTFNQALRVAVAATGLAPKTLAKQCHISTSAMQRWIAGAKPNRTTLPALRRLENALGLTRGTLEGLLGGHFDTTADTTPQPMEIEYRHRLRERVTDRYLLKAEQFLPSLASEWRELLIYKTSTHPRLQRRSGAMWRLLPLTAIQNRPSPLTQVHGLGCTSADAMLGRLRAYWGYLRREVADGGSGLPDSHAQTLASLVVPEWVEGFMQFMKRRAQGKTHQSHAVFASIVVSLVNPEVGYLAQRPELYQRLPIEATQGRPWERLCHETLLLARAWKRAAQDVSRDPSLPIQPLLSLAEPLAPILRTVSRLDQAAAAALPGSVQQAIHRRDALLISLALVNPLRLRTLTLITYRGNTGNLYQRGHEWRLRFQGNDFKNDRGSRQDKYDARVPGLDERIEEYLVEYRPVLIKHCPDCPYLFPSTRSLDGKHTGLHRVIEKITKQYIPEVLSFGPHAFRHLVASAYLKAHPKDYLTVAQLLHDELTTVMSHYAHLSADDAFDRHAEHIAKLKHHRGD
ncbi:hypothetical protein DWG20_03255 [Crenobacter cavernae]|uniref:Tyr recombinase domain-containing protein n=2 Tax=Crenobacter cavernae TaxID=2290923 RepID=A0A345Y3L8_9NEIS|nr:hypothetical protein DWG20_03255 [Crenobacter cavernae]